MPAMSNSAATDTLPPWQEWRVWRWAMHWQILLGIAVGVGLGLWSGSAAAMVDGVQSIPGLGAYAFFGGMFISALKMLIIPLITVSIISAMANIGGEKNFARMGSKTLAFYVLSSALAIIVGLVLVNTIQPGVSEGLRRPCRAKTLEHRKVRI